MKRRRFTISQTLQAWGDGVLRRRIVVQCWATKRGKRRYATREGALKALASQQRAHARGSRAAQRRCVRVYECPACFGWHMTSVPIAQQSGEARAA